MDETQIAYIMLGIMGTVVLMSITRLILSIKRNKKLDKLIEIFEEDK